MVTGTGKVFSPFRERNFWSPRKNNTPIVETKGFQTPKMFLIFYFCLVWKSVRKLFVLAKEIVQYLAECGMEGFTRKTMFGLGDWTSLSTSPRPTKELTKVCRKLTRENMKEQWPLWKAALRCDQNQWVLLNYHQTQQNLINTFKSKIGLRLIFFSCSVFAVTQYN